MPGETGDASPPVESASQRSGSETEKKRDRDPDEEDPMQATRRSDPAAPRDAYTRRMLELLGDQDPIAVMEELVPALETAVSGMAQTEMCRVEHEGKWSILEVMEHLVDTEMVYGYRVRRILAEDEPEIQGFDQDLWARRLRYNEGNCRDALSDLVVLRHRNLRLFRSLGPTELERAGIHAERGRETVGRTLQLMAGHDLGHRMQIERVKRTLGL
jgi:hypothetical protein